MAFVSIITPAYKAESFITRAVDSVLAQSYNDWEHIIIADDLQDYQALLEKYGVTDKRLRFASTGKAKAGPSVARNIGLDMATGQIIAHLDADDAYSPDYLETTLPKVWEHGACTTKMCLIDEQTGVENKELLVLTNDKTLRLHDMIKYNFAYANIVFDRKRCAVRWPEELQYGEDVVLWAMLLDHISAVYFSAQAQYYYYKRSGSLSHLSEWKDNTQLIHDRLNSVVGYLDKYKPLRNQKHFEFLRGWFSVRMDLEEFFNFTIVEPEVYQAEFNRRYSALFGGAV